MPIHKVCDNLFLVDLDLPIPGFARFIGSWVIKKGDHAVIIDPGPAATIHILRAALEEIGITKIEYIFLTHIHLDHAGGCGHLARDHPESVIVSHPKAQIHLSDPTRLWEGSLNVLADLARAYGRPLALNCGTVQESGTVRWKNYIIESLETPGHAPHHVCFFFEDIVFAGEVAGVCMTFAGNTYFRPATPPPFRPDIALKSISLVIGRSPRHACLGHYGFWKNADAVLSAGQNQIVRWLDLITQRRDRGLGLDEEDIANELVSTDPVLSCFSQLDVDTRQRELYFIKNSIRGMLGFINSKDIS